MKLLLIALFFLLPTQAQMDELARKKYPALRILPARKTAEKPVTVSGLKKKLGLIRKLRSAVKTAGFAAALLAALGITAKLVRLGKKIVSVGKKLAPGKKA